MYVCMYVCTVNPLGRQEISIEFFSLAPKLREKSSGERDREISSSLNGLNVCLCTYVCIYVCMYLCIMNVHIYTFMYAVLHGSMFI